MVLKRKIDFRYHIKMIIAATVALLLFVVYFYINLKESYQDIKINSYEIYDEKVLSSIKLAIIADLHNYDFGDGNKELVEKILAQEPEVILMVGDMLDRSSGDIERVLDLIDDLSEIAPIYFGMGNHELDWKELYSDSLEKRLEDAGATVVEMNFCDLELNDQKIRIGGLYDYAFNLSHANLKNLSEERLEVYHYLCEYEDTDAFKIMLSHRPDSFIFGDASKAWDIDLVASGHLHGGQVVFPFLGGVYGGDQGWFPEYVHGLYEKDDMNILVTSGLSTNKKLVPRWNNPPEIVVLELLPANE